MTTTLRQAARKSAVAVLSTALGAGLLTAASVATAPAAQAATTCGGTASIYGVLPDGRLTFSTITPATGALKKVRIGADLGFEPKAMATLNFNTILVTSTSGALYRLDVLTNNESLVLERPPVKIFDSGWTHDKLTYDGHGHLYGTAGGVLLQYLVSQPKPTGSAHIGQRKEIGSGFVLKTLTAMRRRPPARHHVDGRALLVQDRQRRQLGPRRPQGLRLVRLRPGRLARWGPLLRPDRNHGRHVLVQGRRPRRRQRQRHRVPQRHPRQHRRLDAAAAVRPAA